MWLLDVNTPKPLIDVLSEFGIKADTATARGWATLTNGRLVEAAAADGFWCLLTRDRLFGESASQAVKRFQDFAVVLITLSQMKAPQFVESFKIAWKQRPIDPKRGKLISWPE